MSLSLDVCKKELESQHDVLDKILFGLEEEK